MQNVWRFQKKPYLCIAFETEVYGRLAQLVQSIWFTPRGSGVFAFAEDEQKVFKSGFNAYLSKPVHAKLLKEKIQNLINL